MRFADFPVFLVVACACLAASPANGVAASPEPRAPRAAVDVNISLFYDQLAPHGRWVKHDRWGWCWTPNGMPIGWRPYSTGHWVFADECGWTWVADEPWGWAPFHYGRWYWDESLDAWMWVPAEVWGPAWVAWRHGGGYCGWRALPPECGWSATAGLQIGAVDLAVEPGHPCWSFCDERFIVDARLHDHLVVAARNLTLIHRTTEVTRIEVDHERIVNRSVDIARIEKVTGRTVERVHIREVDSVEKLREVKTEGNEVAIFRPAIASSKAEHEPVNREPERPNGVAGGSDELQKRHQAEADDLRKHQDAERTALEQAQKREVDHVPEGQTPEGIQRDHQLERQALEQQHRQQTQRQQQTHEREHAGGGRHPVR